MSARSSQKVRKPARLKQALGALAVVGATAAASAALAPVASAAHQLSKPIVFVHGLDAEGWTGNGIPCDKDGMMWGRMIRKLQEKGWTGTMYPIQYYHEDGTCSGTGVVNGDINHHHPHTEYFGSPGHKDGGHTDDASIKHLAFHWAWWVYDHHTKYDRAIEAVGHSMGGLIIRYAIKEVQNGNGHFPPRLLVEDIVTFGTPHNGAGNVSIYCGTQCDELDSSSAFIDDLKKTAQNPQSAIATRWSVIGATDDERVSVSSSMGMNAMHKVWYHRGQDVGHGTYPGKTSWLHTATVSFKEDGATTWSEGTNGKWPVRLAFGYMGHTNGCPHAWTLCSH